MFQDDIFPPCPAGTPAMTAEEWFGGKNLNPILVKFSEAGLEELSLEASQIVRELPLIQSTVYNFRQS